MVSSAIPYRRRHSLMSAKQSKKFVAGHLRKYQHIEWYTVGDQDSGKESIMTNLLQELQVAQMPLVFSISVKLGRFCWTLCRNLGHLLYIWIKLHIDRDLEGNKIAYLLSPPVHPFLDLLEQPWSIPSCKVSFSSGQRNLRFCSSFF